MKFSIARHEEMLKNNRVFLEKKRATLNRMIEEFAFSEARFKFYKEQIEEAKRRGKDGFDSDKFMKKRSPKLGGNSDAEGSNPFAPTVFSGNKPTSILYL